MFAGPMRHSIRPKRPLPDMATPLFHPSDNGGRHRRSAIAVACSPALSLRVEREGGVPESHRGRQALRHFRGMGPAAFLNFGASTGALRREVDDVVPARVLRLPHGHFDDPFDLHVSVASKSSERRISGAEECFAFGGNHD